MCDIVNVKQILSMQLSSKIKGSYFAIKRNQFRELKVLKNIYVKLLMAFIST